MNIRRIWPVCLLAAMLPLSGCETAGARPKAPVIVTPLRASGNAQTGKASYYGAKFQGRKTASGEAFDRHAMTAAHPSLPFQTRVKVTCLSTKKSVVVRINDRFPSIGSRIIDLSEAAFARIAPLSQGVVSVEVEVLR